MGYILKTNKNYDEPENDEEYYFYAKSMFKNVESISDSVQMIKKMISYTEVLMHWQLNNKPKSIIEKLSDAFVQVGLKPRQ